MGKVGGNIRKWLRVNGGPLLLVVGIAFIALAIWKASFQALASTLAVLGAGSIVLGLLLERAVGTIKLGPTGIEMVLGSIEDEAITRGLDPEAIFEALKIAVEKLEAQNYRLALSLGSEKTKQIAEELAHASVDEALDERAFESIAIEELTHVANSLGASISIQKAQGSVRWDAIIHSDSGAIGIEIKNRFVPGERSLRGQIMLAINQSKKVDAILLLLNKDVVSASELERAKKAWGPPVTKRWPIRIVPWSPASGTDLLAKAISELLKGLGSAHG